MDAKLTELSIGWSFSLVSYECKKERKEGRKESVHRHSYHTDKLNKKFQGIPPSSPAIQPQALSFFLSIYYSTTSEHPPKTENQNNPCAEEIPISERKQFAKLSYRTAAP